MIQEFSTDDEVIFILFNNNKFGYIKKIFISNKLSLVGAIIVLIFIFVVIFGSIFATIPPDSIDYDNILSPPSSTNYFGTDQYGRDLFSRVVFGARTSLGIGFLVVTFSTIFGLCIGTVSGYLGGKIDNFIMRLVDLLMAFPAVIIAMVLATIIGGGIKTLIMAMLISSWTGTARIARGETLSLKQSGYVTATRALSGGWVYILFYHILPNVLPPILVSATLSFGNIILNTAGLSFIGVGVQPPISEWGLIISEGRQYIVTGQWWLIFFPGLAIMLTVTGLNLLGDGLRDIFDPRQRR